MRTDIRLVVLLAATCAILACDGPHEDAGERADALRGATGGESSMIAGPAEKAGERMDRQQARQAAAAGPASR